ncbi:histone-lysine N-methyltransferase 2D isoform X2 [Limanda limanda]|uniref:histone-lysine N-methyltransferase 2D isoform X2 n=1 Tax=Limanda limanda TaxID=27771 RepID=UPI0029C7C88A|nr:histone-lysine N-methyltransferase 2D isoform X2 [Limanda limanda]
MSVCVCDDDDAQRVCEGRRSFSAAALCGFNAQQPCDTTPPPPPCGAVTGCFATGSQSGTSGSGCAPLDRCPGCDVGTFSVFNFCFVLLCFSCRHFHHLHPDAAEKPAGVCAACRSESDLRGRHPPSLPPAPSSSGPPPCPQRGPLPSEPQPLLIPPPQPSLPRRRLRRAGDALTGSRWFPAEGHVYVSFVRKSILWERGICHYTARARPTYRPLQCPRFLSHMKAHPEDLRPAAFQSSRPQPPSQGTRLHTHVLAAPNTRVPEGCLHLSPDRRRDVVQSEGLSAGWSSAAVVVPCPPLPVTPPPAAINPTPPHQNTLHPASGRKKPASPPRSPPAPKEDEQPQEREEAVASVSEPDSELQLRPVGSQLSQGSLSDLSRPPSSSFSRSTNLTSGRSSVLSAAVTRDSDPEDGSSAPQPSPVTSPLLPSLPPSGSDPHQPSLNIPPVCEPLFGQTTPLSSRPTSRLHPNSDKPLSSRQSTRSLPGEAFVDLHPSSDSDRGLVPLAFPSATWSSCPSPQTTSPRSGSAAGLSPSPPLSRLESHRWPVLPPISPVRGRCGTAASHDSELSCSHSHMFDELEAIAPSSISCRSQEQASDSSGGSSPHRELSPGLAALTMGCDSGNLGPLSRVQLLLLDRPEPETSPSPCGLEDGFPPLEDWMQYDAGLTPEGARRPLTAGSISERCDSAGRVQGNKSDLSDEGSGSPSSWIIDPSPSANMFRSSCSPCPSDHSCSSVEGGPTEEESDYPGRVGSSAEWRSPERLDHRTAETEGKMEERRTKVLTLLSKLQDAAPQQGGRSKASSNFEDFDFLAKYCIFSQEKLEDYKRAFDEEDGDGDGYISSVQALLALKHVIPSEMLSDEEEIYVCRILEMVDFRMTDGLVDLRLFSVIASLAQKIATMDEFMRSLIGSMDFRSLEVRLFKAKRLFLFLLEEPRGDDGAQQGFISAEQLLLELKAGGIHLEQEPAITLQLQHFPPLDLLDFLAYLPLFMLIHNSVISNPLDDSSHL